MAFITTEIAAKPSIAKIVEELHLDHLGDDRIDIFIDMIGFDHGPDGRVELVILEIGHDFRSDGDVQLSKNDCNQVGRQTIEVLGDPPGIFLLEAYPSVVKARREIELLEGFAEDVFEARFAYCALDNFPRPLWPAPSLSYSTHADYASPPAR